MPESPKSESTMSETYRHFTRLFPYPHERIPMGAPAADAMARYDELAKLGRAEGFVPFFLNLNDTVLESMVIAVSLEHDIIDDVETLTPEQVSAYTRAVLQRYRTARGAASAEEYGSAAIAQQLRRVAGDGEDTSEDDPDDFNLNELVDEFMSSDFLPDEEPEDDAPTLSALLRYELADEEDQGEMLLLQVRPMTPPIFPRTCPLAAGMTARTLKRSWRSPTIGVKSTVPSRRLLTVLTAWSFWWNAPSPTRSRRRIWRSSNSHFVPIFRSRCLKILSS